MSYYSTGAIKHREEIVKLLVLLGFTVKRKNKVKLEITKNNKTVEYTVSKGYILEEGKRIGTGIRNLLTLYNVKLKEKKETK